MPSSQSIQSWVQRMDHYFRYGDERLKIRGDCSLPQLEKDWNDRDNDGQIDLDPSGGEVSLKWSSLLGGIARSYSENPAELSSFEVSKNDWIVQEDTLNFLDSSFSGRLILPNGLEVIGLKDPSRRLMYAACYVHSGPLDIPSYQKALPHAVEHAQVGSPPQGSRWRFAEALAQEQASLSRNFTFYDRVFFGLLERSVSQKAFNDFIQMILNERYSKERIRQERDHILIKELEMWKVNLKQIMSSRMLAGLYPNQDWEGETLVDIQNVSLQDLVDYHRRTYIPNNMAVMFLGPSLREAVNIVALSPVGKMPAQLHLPSSPTLDSQTDQGVKIVHSGEKGFPPFTATHGYLGFAVPPRYQNPASDAAFEAALFILNRRLEEALEGTKFKAHIQWDDTVDEENNNIFDRGTAVLFLDGRATDFAAVYQALQRVRSTLGEWQNNPISAEELEEVKREVAQEGEFSEQDPFGVIERYLAGSRYANTLVYWKEWKKAVLSITTEEVTAASHFLSLDKSYAFVALQSGLKVDSNFSLESLENVLLQDSQSPEEGVSLSQIKQSSRAVSSSPEPKPIPPAYFDRQVAEVSPLSEGVLKLQLQNGVTLIISNNPNSSKVAGIISAPLRMRDEPIGKEGLRRLTAQVLKMGPVVIDGTHVDNDSFSISLQSEKEDFSLRLLSLINPDKKIEPDERNLKRAKKLLTAQLKSKMGDRFYFLRQSAVSFLYPDLMAVRPELGSTDTIAQMSTEDISEVMKTFWDPQKLTVSLSGAFNLEHPEQDSLLLQIVSIFSLLLTAKEETPPVVQAEQPLTLSFNSQPLREDQLTVLHLNSAQGAYLPEEEITNSYVSVQKKGPRFRDPDFISYFLFLLLLGNRLYLRLRQGNPLGRRETIGYLLEVWLKSNEYETEGERITQFLFGSSPNEVQKVLQDYREEYEALCSDYPPTPEELSVVVEKWIDQTFQEAEPPLPRARESLDLYRHPWYFNNRDSSVTEVRDLNDLVQRLRAFPIDTILQRGAKYFNFFIDPSSVFVSISGDPPSDPI